jgi:hypothetical protein
MRVGGFLMPVDSTYRKSVKSVLVAARDLDEALPDGDVDELTSLANSLLSSALARESGDTVAGFRHDEAQTDAAVAPGAIAAPATAEEELSLALTELEIGEVLLTSAAATAAQQQADRAQAGSALSDAIDRLDTAADDLGQPGVPAVSGFLGTRQPSPEAFFDQLPKTVTGIVDRTAELGIATVKGLAKIPTAQLQPVFGAAWSLTEPAVNAVPEASALARAGMRAIARALRAIAQLVPEKLRQQIPDWAKDWWEQHATDIARNLARRVLSAAELDAFITKAVTDAKKRADLDGSLREGYSRLIELDERHARIIKVIERIVDVLSHLVGPLALVFPPAATWVYVSGGSGMITALGVSVWVGRDYLDAGVPFERVPGVRLIVTQATSAPTGNG